MDFKLNEDFFDDIEQDEIINTDEIVIEPDEEKHTFAIYVDTLRDKEYNKTYINLQVHHLVRLKVNLQFF